MLCPAASLCLRSQDTLQELIRYPAAVPAVPTLRLCLLALFSKDSSLFVCSVWKLLNPTLHVSKHKACLTVSASKLDVQ